MLRRILDRILSGQAFSIWKDQGDANACSRFCYNCGCSQCCDTWNYCIMCAAEAPCR